MHARQLLERLARYLRDERSVSAHDATSLVNEAYLRLVGLAE